MLLAALLVTSVAGDCSPQSTDNPKVAADALDYYLNVDCLVGEKRKPLAQLLELQKRPGLQFKQLVEDRLAQFLNEGSDLQNVLTSHQSSLDQEWAQRETYLQKITTHRELYIPELRSLQRVTKTEYMDQQRKRLALKYRKRAAIALAAIGSKSALATLKEVERKGDKDMQRTIQSALKRFQQ